MTRRTPLPDRGLSSDEVNERFEMGLVNVDSPIKTKSVFRIISDNILTLFNAVNFIIALALFFVGSYRNMLFCGVVISNLFIGIVQEIRAKIATDKLTLISQNECTVIREGNKLSVKNDAVVIDDVLLFHRGDSIVCDCILLDGECEVNESLITGESDPIFKKSGDMLLSGSFIVSGTCRAKAENIGNDHYASKISSGAKYIKKVNSQIMGALNSIIKTVAVIIFPIGVILFTNNYLSLGLSVKDSVESMAAAVIGMIPEGLMLLVSTVLAVSVVRLAHKKVLVQELYCIETLARVDTLCLDKTGTLTEGNMTIEDIIYVSEKCFADEILLCFTSSATDTNPTFDAIKARFKPTQIHSGYTFYPFSSSRKYSALVKDGETYYLGAGEIICPDSFAEHTSGIPKGRRILALCRQNEALCFIVIKDKIKKNAKNILEYFTRQKVNIKIISGDSAETVSAIAKELGVKNFDSYTDTSKFSDEHDFENAAEKFTIFGRVTPNGKEMLIRALQKNGHTVAMTGDGVNDVLALKAADCSVAMANGSAAARNVSHLILLDSDFDSLPDIVYEGRRSINNIRRSASLFLVKTLYTFMLSLVYLFLALPYPFIPIQLTLISVMTIGIPSFVLALEPSNERVSEAFLSEILKKAFPTALAVTLNVVIISLLTLNGTIPSYATSTIATAVTGFCGLYLLFKLCIPFNRQRIFLTIAMTIGFFGATLLFAEVFEFVPLTTPLLAITLILMFVSIFLFEASQRFLKFIASRVIK
ncbi:MAG: cation-translocating P-type ATPase [Ruminococcaceae bacterium]|nr:cation-translocating P-type ATPase [Oscillospiraceae bacterium]